MNTQHYGYISCLAAECGSDMDEARRRPDYFRTTQVLSREIAIATLSMHHDEIGRDRIVFAGICASYLIQKRFGHEPVGFDPNKIGNFDWPSDPIVVRSILNDARQAANNVSQRIEHGLENQQQADSSRQTRKSSEQSR